MAQRAALYLFLGLLVWAPWPLGSNRPWAWSLLEGWVFVCAALWLIAWMRRDLRSLGVLRDAWPALAILGAWLVYLALYWIPLPAGLLRMLSPESAALGARTLSIDPNASFVFWLKSCAYAAAFALVLALATTRERARMIAYALVLSGLLQAVYGALMHLAGTDVDLFGARIAHSSQASGAFVNRNHLAGFLEIGLAMGIGLLVGSLQESGRRTWRQFWRDTARMLLSARAPLRLFLVAMVIGLVMTRSRMGNTAFFSSLLIAGSVALLLRRHATRSTVILIASLIVIDIFIVGTWFGVEKTLDRLQQTTAVDVEQRVEPSVYALDMLKDYPVLGAGAGSFYGAFPRYRGPDIGAFYDHAHNDYTQFLVETGPLGALLIGTLPLLALINAVLVLSRRRDPLARGFAFAALMGVTAIAIHSTVDFNLQIPANALAFVVLLAYAWIALFSASGPSARHSPERRP
ncbi:MAG: O-antigen ligase domain-containing protein [Betaproteobacteria bacterium]|nr:MAG: O-antigen ligase domain-containing protein [Betaproteobacteria bacterium]